MTNGTKSKKFSLFLFYFLINISFSIQKVKKFNLGIPINQDKLGSLYFTEENFIETCNWIPSLFNPILLAKDMTIINGILIENSQFTLNSPIFYNQPHGFQVELYMDVIFSEYNLFLAESTRKNALDNCYFGISSRIEDYKGLNETQITLNQLKNQDEKIFSFDKWDLNSKFINSTFYFGGSNEVFRLNNGNIGTCSSYGKGFSWGCFFKEMIFNNTNIPLKFDNGTLYKIYFSTENHYLIFPEIFKEKLEKISNNKCQYKDDIDISKLVCKNYFNTREYFPIKFINDDMEITGEIDNENRFNEKDVNKIDNTRIIFKDIDYIILPLIVFKNFYIEFNAINNIISFYTDKDSILVVKSKEQKNNNGSNTVLTIFIVILIIILILVLSFGIFYLIKNKNQNVEKSINKFNKLEEEEDFHNMNENRVF